MYEYDWRPIYPDGAMGAGSSPSFIPPRPPKPRPPRPKPYPPVYHPTEFKPYPYPHGMPIPTHTIPTYPPHGTVIVPPPRPTQFGGRPTTPPPPAMVQTHLFLKSNPQIVQRIIQLRPRTMAELNQIIHGRIPDGAEDRNNPACVWWYAHVFDIWGGVYLVYVIDVNQFETVGWAFIPPNPMSPWSPPMFVPFRRSNGDIASAICV